MLVELKNVMAFPHPKILVTCYMTLPSIKQTGVPVKLVPGGKLFECHLGCLLS